MNANPNGGAAGQGSGQGQAAGGRPDVESESERGQTAVITPPDRTGGEQDNVDAGSGSTPAERVGSANGPTAAGVRTAPLGEVLPEYTDRAVEALDHMQIAPSQADVVRDYFSRLANPEG
ncbi:MAG: hypothetical protein H6512_08980 [Acidimicrobiia bacterium]|nr:hypothetical protein [Acidimicrobiia bacterium]